MVRDLLRGRRITSRSRKRITAAPTPAMATARRLVLEQPGQLHLLIVVYTVPVEVDVVE